MQNWHTPGPGKTHVHTPCNDTITKKAGLRTLHDLGPEIRRAISGNLDDDFDFREEEPMHRVKEIKKNEQNEQK